MIQIPVTNQPNQKFKVAIPLADTNISIGFFIYWNRIAGYWQVTLTDALTNTELINGLPLLTGNYPVANVLRQQEYFGIGQMFVVPISSNAPDHPGLEDWGVNFALMWDD